jgi:hypothetical protein
MAFLNTIKRSYFLSEKSFFLLLLSFLLFPSCEKEGTKTEMIPKGPPAFKLLKKDLTGLDFQNVIKQDLDFNVFNYMYIYNGGGVAAGDFNKDGKADLYFTSNMGPNKLFLNEGDFKFKDVSAEAGVQGLDGWTTGASVVDINNDGLLDIYVCQVGDYKVIKGKNQLFICTGIENGIPLFEDKAAEYGLDFIGFSTQASFFDYDLDGDLDMYLLNHSLHANGTFGKRDVFEGTIHPESGDKLFRNENGKFKDVTEGSGIFSTVIGYGLGIVTGDINNDGWPDIYIGNDFHENDYLYINQKNGTFKESLTDMIMHTSRFSMGVDMADINNDGNSDIISLDMMPEDPIILKSSLGEDDYGVFHFKLGYGYNYQFARNNLQLNNGDGTFSEIGMYAGMHATDWSWSPLFVDFDNDGFKDIFISNGIPRRMNDIDYVNFRKTHDDFRWKTRLDNTEKSDLDVIEKMPQIKLGNKFLRNTKDLKFEDLESLVGDDEASYSNGCISVDLDGDGDLDMVVNNLEDEPFVYQNLLENKAEKGAFLEVKFKGPEKNVDGIGSSILVFKKDGSLIRNEFYPVRGYISSVLAPMHVGIGKVEEVDSVLVIWPDRTYETIRPEYNKTSTLEYQKGLPEFSFEKIKKERLSGERSIRLVDITKEAKLDFIHKENPFVEFNRETLIPFMVSQAGPGLAIGDVNGDGLEDVFIGSSKRNRAALYTQNANGTFKNSTPDVIFNDSIYEDVDATWADLDNDGDLDLLVASGGNEYQLKDEPREQRAYINNEGTLIEKLVFPGIFSTASKILTNDVNNDGLQDVLITGRSVPWTYGEVPETYLLINKGNLKFEEQTDNWSKELKNAGLVRNALFYDIDKDGDDDLVLALEWEPITIFKNTGKSFEKQIIGNGEKGWWNFAIPADVDQDGDLDFLVGNVGENNKLKPSPETPVKMYLNDFDDNGQKEQLLTYHLKGREIPFANYEELTKQLVFLKKNFLYANDMAKAPLEDLFTKEKLENGKVWEANNFSNGVFINDGQMNFTFHSLPPTLQLSSLMDAVDLKNGSWVVAGNFYPNNIELGRYDANFGNILSFGNDGKMRVFGLGDLKIKGEVRHIAPIKIKGKDCLIFARNNDSLLITEIQNN